MSRSSLIVMVLALVGSLSGASGVLAHAGTSPSPGITTVGYGEASAPAESANLQILIIDQDSFYGGPPMAPEVEATPGAAARTTVAPIAEAIEQAESVDSVEVVVPLITSPFGGPAPVARIDVTVSSPDLDILKRLITDATQAAAAERLMVGYVGASFETSDCHALERAARQAALEDARGRAGIQADLLGVGLGEVVATADVESAVGQLVGLYGGAFAPSNGCEPPAPSLSGGDPNSGVTLPSFDPSTHSGEVEIYRQLQVTFAIEGTEATPAA